MAKLPRPLRRMLRRVRRWWRGTPSRELGQTLAVLGVILVVGAAVLMATLL